MPIQRREPPNYFFDELDPEHHLADSQLLTRDLSRSRLVILEGSSMMITSDPAATKAVLDFLRDVDTVESGAAGREVNLELPTTDQSRGMVTVLGSVGCTAPDGRSGVIFIGDAAEFVQPRSEPGERWRSIDWPRHTSPPVGH